MEIQELKQLCETLWKRVSKSREGHSALAEEFIERLGWEPTPIACPGDVFRTAAVSYLFEAQGSARAVAHFLLPTALKPPSAVLDRNLDFSETTRTLVNATRMMNVQFAFITDFCHAYLYDTMSEALLLTANHPGELAFEFHDVIDQQAVAAGSLEEVRRPTRGHIARQLRDWAQKWYNTLTLHWQASEAMAWRTLDRMLLLRYMADRHMLRRPGWHLRHQFVELLAKASSPDSQGTGRALTALFNELWTYWNTSLFESEPRLDAILEQDSLAVSLLRETGLLSRQKFELLTILESFNYGDAAEKARVRMIPEEDKERLAWLDRQRPEDADAIHLTVDLSDEGYRAIMYWFDHLMATYERLAMQYTAAGNGEAFMPAALHDPLRHGVEHGLVLYHTTPRQQRTACLLLHLHLIDICREHGIALTRFPLINNALVQRPGMLEKDKRQFMGDAEAAAWEGAL